MRGFPLVLALEFATAWRQVEGRAGNPPTDLDMSVTLLQRCR